MIVLPFQGGACELAIFASLGITVLGLAIGLLLRRGLDLVLDPDDSRRQRIADAIMYGGILLAMVVSLLIHWRG
jgi:NhaP-type Na+/H+ or K+/H+ antiporter